MEEGMLKCDRCNVGCEIRPDKLGECGMYVNKGGALVRTIPLTPYEEVREIVGEEFIKLIGNLPQGEAIVKGTALRCRFPIWVKVLPEVYPASADATPMSRFLSMELASQVEARGLEPLAAND